MPMLTFDEVFRKSALYGTTGEPPPEEQRIAVLESEDNTYIAFYSSEGIGMYDTSSNLAYIFDLGDLLNIAVNIGFPNNDNPSSNKQLH